jgi:branched-chain amino acid transport system substrate-binding protein
MHEIEQNNLLKGKKIELVVQDVPLEKPKDAPSAFNYLTDTENVVAIIGPMGSGGAMSVVSLVDAKQIPIIVHAASVRGATDNNEYLLRLWPTADQYAEVIFSEIEKRGYSRVAFLSATHENTADLSLLLKERLGSRLVIEEQVSVETKDFRTQLTKIKQANPDAVFINLFAGQIGVAGSQARLLDITVPFFTNSVMSITELAKGEDALEQIWFPQFRGYTEASRAKFVAYLGKEPAIPDNATAGHDALIAIAQAIAEVGSDSERIKDYLYSHEFTGAVGEFSFDKTGNAKLPISLLTVDDGKIVEVQ